MNSVLAHFWEVVAILLLPAVPVGAAWLRMNAVIRASEQRWRVAAFLLVLQSAALLHVLLGIFDRHLLGPDYSSVRFGVVGAWLAITALTVVLGIIKNPIRWFLIPVGIYLFLDWFYIGVVSSVV